MEATHRRQFLLAPRPYLAAADWKAIRLPGDYCLSHSSYLPSFLVDGPEGVRWALLGDARQTNRDLPDPVSQLASLDPTAVLSAIDDWSGTWALVGDGRVITDLGSLLGVYYTREAADGSGRALVASSLPLIAELRGDDMAPSPRLQWQSGFDWYPPPRTGLNGVKKLLASQSLRLPEGSPESRKLNIVGASNRSREEKVDHVLSVIGTSLRRLTQPYETLWLALTAGYDSRTTLAAALNGGLDVRTFTVFHGGLSHGDRTIPPILAERSGVPHRFIRARHPARASRCRRWDAHHGGTSVEIDREFYARGQYDFARENDVIVRSGCYEASKCLYWSLMNAGEGFPDASYILHELGIKADAERERAINEWRAWAQATPEPGLDWRNRFYAEQRMGGWLSATEQALTLLPARSLQPANSSAVISALWDFPLAARRSGEHQREVVARVAPELDELPYNPKKSVFARKVKKRIFRTYTRASRRVTTAKRTV